ncbi:hypothetical protein NWE55_15475 [Myroides albus]|uniref:hypothetical protein n=1 Tax=Myroides albus TaxID=2562892 RepID=UPI002158CD44|nr:hypothetical protein [Myroides albus]UVD79503.1 hypothetical protein NWE55_15475 [Myroides albus]
MKQQLFEVLFNKVDDFISHFEKVPLKRFNNGLAWEQFYFSYFSSMTNTLIHSMNHLDYVQFNSYVIQEEKLDNIGLTYNHKNELVRAINYEENKENHKLITKYLQDNLDKIRTNKQADTYQKISCKYEIDNTTYFITGTAFVDSDTQSVTIACCSLEINGEITYKEDSYTPTLNKATCEEVYQEFIALDDCSEIAAHQVAEEHKISLDILNKDFIYYYGDQVINYCKKERLLKSLELLLFSSIDTEQIARKSGFKNWNELLETLSKIPNINMNTLIRYN